MYQSTALYISSVNKVYFAYILFDLILVMMLTSIFFEIMNIMVSKNAWYNKSHIWSHVTIYFTSTDGTGRNVSILYTIR